MRTSVTDIIKFIAIALIVLTVYGVVGNIETHYNRVGTVDSIEGNVITIIDTTDNVWCYEVEENSYIKGDKVTMKMFNNYTDNCIYDDVIEKVL